MLKQHLSIALRSFRKNRLYSVINVIGLSVGLASAILIMLYLQHELSADRHHEHYEEMYRVGVEMGIGGQPVKTGLSSFPAGPQLKENFHEITDFTRFFSLDLVFDQMLIELENNSLYETGIWLVDSNFFEFFTHHVVHGDPKAAIRHNNMAVLPQAVAERIFGPGNPVGKSFRLNKTHHIEVGAVINDIPDNTHLKFRMVMFWNSMDGILNKGLAGNSYFQNNLYTYLKANQDLNTKAFMAKVDDFLTNHVLNDWISSGRDFNYRLHFSPMRDLYFIKDELYEPRNPEVIPAKGDMVFINVFIIIAIFLVVIASINYINMAIARSTSRAKEVGVKKVIGANQKNLFWQFLTESFLTCFFAFLFALLWVEMALPSFNNLLIKNLVFNPLSNPVLIISILTLVVLVGFLSGSYPALYLSGLKPLEVLKQQARLSDRNLFGRKFMVGLQLTISVFMIIVTIVVISQIFFMRNKDLGYETNDVLTINLSDLDPTRRESFKNELLQLEAVKSATQSAILPGPGTLWRNWGFDVETKDGFVNHMTGVYHVDAKFADVYQIEIIEGRFFNPETHTDLTQSLVINESAVRQFGWDNPIGKQIIHQNTDPRRVIGVVKDFHTTTLEHIISPLVIFPTENSLFLSLKIAQNASSTILQPIERVWSDVAGHIPLRYQFMDERHTNAYKSYINLGHLFTSFAVLCIFLSLLGLFGLSGYTTKQKSREIGIRIIYGANLSDILILLYREYTWLMGLAVVTASGFAMYFIDNWLARFAYRISLGPGPFLLAALMSIAVSLLTIGYHAFRSSRANPVEALKYE